MGYRRQSGTVDPTTDPDCTYFDTAYSASDDCSHFESFWGISHADFVAWNPSIKSDCSGLKVGYSYCVEVHRKPSATTSTAGPTSSNAPKPSPTQDGLISSCTDFYFAVKGDNCNKIVQRYGTFTIGQFISWNPAVGEDCSGLWANTYYCVGIPGTPTTKPAVPATPTGSPKPSPTQDGLIKSCTSFYFAVKGDTCTKIVQKYKTFNVADFIAWNPAVGSDCGGLWADTYYCVGVPGTQTAPPTAATTTAGNGVTTPEPTQPGMVSTCNAFYFVKKGDNCRSIADAYGITVTQFTAWNPEVGGLSCTGLWVNVYVCVNIIGRTTTGTPTGVRTTTTAASSCKTTHPEPTQPGSICACKKWHHVVKGQYCRDIEKLYGITEAQFNAWNPEVGKDCLGLWVDYSVCVSA